MQSTNLGRFRFCTGFWTPAITKDPRAQLAGEKVLSAGLQGCSENLWSCATRRLCDAPFTHAVGATVET
jgi:hypothetical protein